MRTNLQPGRPGSGSVRWGRPQVGGNSPKAGWGMPGSRPAAGSRRNRAVSSGMSGTVSCPSSARRSCSKTAASSYRPAPGSQPIRDPIRRRLMRCSMRQSRFSRFHRRRMYVVECAAWRPRSKRRSRRSRSCAPGAWPHREMRPGRRLLRIMLGPSQRRRGDSTLPQRPRGGASRLRYRAARTRDGG